MQTPAGFHVVGEGSNARAEITDFWAMVFNPSAMDRLSHTLCGAWQAGAFLVVSVSAFYLLRRKHLDFAQRSLKVGLAVGLVASLLQLVTGHDSAVGVSRHQPVKMAAFEGQYDSLTHAPLTLFGWVNESEERTYALEVPGLLSYLLHGDTAAEVKGLRELAPDPEDRPPVNLTFQFYHAMIAIGFGMIAVSLTAAVFWWRGRLFQTRWLLWLLVFSVLGPQLANQFGWYAAEVGRQPWIVYGLLRTSEGISRVVQAEAVLGSLILFAVIYLLLFAVFVYLLNDKIQHGPDPSDLKPTGKLSPRPESTA